MTPKNGMRPVHPGEILRDELQALGMSANALSKALGVPVNRVTAILHGQRGVTADTALRLARYFGTTPQVWLNLQQTYELRRAEITVGRRIAESVQPQGYSGVPEGSDGKPLGARGAPVRRNMTGDGPKIVIEGTPSQRRPPRRPMITHDIDETRSDDLRWSLCGVFLYDEKQLPHGDEPATCRKCQRYRSATSYLKRREAKKTAKKIAKKT